MDMFVIYWKNSVINIFLIHSFFFLHFLLLMLLKAEYDIIRVIYIVILNVAQVVIYNHEHNLFSIIMIIHVYDSYFIFLIYLIIFIWKHGRKLRYDIWFLFTLGFLLNKMYCVAKYGHNSIKLMSVLYLFIGYNSLSKIL